MLRRRGKPPPTLTGNCPTLKAGHDCTVRTAQAERDQAVEQAYPAEAAVSHHKRSDEWKNDIDVALYKARDKILSDAASGER